MDVFLSLDVCVVSPPAWTFRQPDGSPPRRFAAWTFLHLDDSPPKIHQIYQRQHATDNAGMSKNRLLPYYSYYILHWQTKVTRWWWTRNDNENSYMLVGHIKATITDELHWLRVPQRIGLYTRLPMMAFDCVQFAWSRPGYFSGIFVPVHSVELEACARLQSPDHGGINDRATYLHFAVRTTFPFIVANCVEQSPIWTEGHDISRTLFKSALKTCLFEHVYS